MGLTVAEQLLYSTVKLTSSKGGVAGSTGTGFFMNFPLDGEQSVVVLVTNKHVIEEATEVTAVCHLADGDAPSGNFAPCTVMITADSVVPHPDPGTDLCALFFGPILNQAHDMGRPLFFCGLDPDLIPADDEWENFDAIEDVTMIGCPRGISDEINNLPIVRRGITASALSKKYNGKGEFMVDMACFPGSSGSPIFLYDRNGYYDRKNNTYRMGLSRLKLVGVLYAGPLVTNDGRVVLEQVPRVIVNSMMHLGNALRATALREIEVEIKRRL
jgi:hypothetical protein